MTSHMPRIREACVETAQRRPLVRCANALSDSSSILCCGRIILPTCLLRWLLRALLEFVLAWFAPRFGPSLHAFDDLQYRACAT